MQRCFVSLAFVAVFVAVCLAACSGQGEGQRCSTADDGAGQSDCANNLVCTPGLKLPSGAATEAVKVDPTYGVCCPSSPSAGDPVAICALQSLKTGPDGGFPADASTSDGPSLGDAGDAATDAPAEAAPADSAPGDAATDAPVDAAAG